MKNLELNQMELVEGGLSCGSVFGLAAAGIFAGVLVIASGPIGWGAALYFGSGVVGAVNGVTNC